MNNGLINGERIRQARELRGLTQKDLADRIEVRQSAIAQIEGGVFQPNERIVNAISMQTGFPRDFFRQPPSVDFPLGSLLFRARASMTATQRVQAYRYGQVIYGIAESMARRMRGFEPRLPRLDDDPVTAASILRATFGVSPDVPFPNLIHKLELHGVFVLRVPTPLEKRDAFSVWAGSDPQRPVIVITADAPGDRLRFSVAHEVRHLLTGPSGTIPDIERDADRFASELLMPEDAMRQEMVPPVTLSLLATMKLRWGVAIAALAHRAHDLTIISDRQYRYLFEQISRSGWRTSEPDHLAIPPERPRAMRQMAEKLYGNPLGEINYQKLAADVHLTTRFVQDVIEAHAGREAKKSVQQEQAPSDNLRQFPRNRKGG